MAHPLVILIATAGRSDSLQRTLDSLAECVIPKELTATIIVENGPPHGAEALVAAAAPELKAKYRHSPPANKSLALNAALEEIDSATLIYFADDDVTFEPSVLMRYVETARGYQRRAYFGGPFHVNYETRPPEWLIPLLPLSARGWNPAADRVTSGSHLMIGFNWAAFAGDLRDAGGFDPRFGPGGTTGGTGQEHEMQRRLLAAGSTAVFVPGAVVWHDVPPQRCSAEFAVQRQYRYGIQIGHSLDKDNAAMLAGVPRWRVRELWRLRLRYVSRCLLPGKEQRLKARLNLARAKGIVRGIRDAR